ncbi:MAG TPA: hypothetical protein VF296_05245 [Gallionella sp.]
MEILVVLVVMAGIMLIASRFDNAAGSSDKASDGDEGNYSGLDDDWTTDPSYSFFLGNIWHEDD